MNIVLLEAGELSSDAVATLRGRRAEHILQVLRPSLGATLRAGIIDGGRGTLVVQAMADDSVTVQFLPEQGDAASPLATSVTAGTAVGFGDLTVVLAVPRPKALSRVIESLATFGVRRVVLCTSWRVDKAYAASPRMALAALRANCVLGAEQGGHTRLPQVVVYARFMQMLDAEFANASSELRDGTAVRVGLGQRLVAHPGAAVDALGYTSAAVRPHVVAIGPEGGWIERELASFADRGFAPLWLSSSILRVETAVAVVLGQLELAVRAVDAGQLPVAASAQAQEPHHG